VINYVGNCVRKCVGNCEETWDELSEDLRGTNCRNSVSVRNYVNDFVRNYMGSVCGIVNSVRNYEVLCKKLKAEEL